MKKKLTIISIFVFACLQFAWHTEPQKNIAAVQFRKWMLQELKLLKQNISGISRSPSLVLKKRSYTAARKNYKHLEFFIEFYSPLPARLYINGPLVPKHEIDLGKKMIPPQGFQRIEEILYNENGKRIKAEVVLLQEQINALENYYKDAEITDGNLLEMCQFQLFRMASLNLNGYDATITQTNITETLWALEGIEKTILFFKPYTNQKQEFQNVFLELQKQIAKGKALLLKNKDYNSFNRMEFITQFINPLNEMIVNFHNLSGLPWNQNKKALRLQNGFLFGEESFNPQFFSIYYYDTLHLNEQAEIGKKLFYDPILSDNNRLSCASCHNPSKAFADGLAKSISIDSNEHVNRNAPTLLNVIYQKVFFYDGRVYQLEQQAFDVIHNPIEMKSSLSDVVNRLRESENYKELFAKAFINTAEEQITEYAVQKCLAEYQKTLVSFNSRFDKYLHGDISAMNKREINGYNIFAGKALCGSCHFTPLFNGTVPPYFTDSEFEVIGTPANADNKRLDEDEGRFAISGLEEQRFAFKTPTVRNIELTAPYMHNGVYSTLEEVVEFYHRGGGNGFGFNIPNQTLPFDSLQLSAKEKEDIVLFLKTLTDTSGYKK